MNKTVIKIGNIIIESDSSVDLEIDGDVVRVKGKTPTPIVITQPAQPITYPIYPDLYPWSTWGS
jgi:hypothetical protein